MRKIPHTAWQNSSSWYDTIVGYWGHHYHQNVIIPKVCSLLRLKKESILLDLACGQGVLARHIPQEVGYVGIDGAKALIQKAKQYHKDDPSRQFVVADITKPLPLPKERRFSHAACLLAIQNIEHPVAVFKAMKPFLAPSSTCVIVMNHPCFRIPRQSSWGFDESSKIQYRRMNCYMTPQKIPITTHPSHETTKKEVETTISFHLPLSAYISALTEAGFAVTGLEEWCSDKVSTGKASAWENRARSEFPLFLAIKATCLS